MSTAATLVHESDSLDESRPYYFAACIDSTIPSDTYEATIAWSAIAVDTQPPVANGALMQTITNANCPADRTWVVDARDNRTYWIRKIANSGGTGVDLCWMEANLAYAGGGTNTYSDVKTLTTTATGTVMENTTARVNVSVTLPSGAPQFTTNPTVPTTGSGAATGASGAQYGYHYNWCAAMGGTGVNPNA
ncbi:hypothetical protein AGMMS49975_14350 [Clostridia bacterium]|nr:hypothetical protein AGMMS49975_14350 [Clostridia bacterium]